MRPHTQFGLRPQMPGTSPAGKLGPRSAVRPTAEGATQLRQDALGQALDDLMRSSPGACTSIQTVLDAQRAAQAYLASLGPVVLSIVSNAYRGDRPIPTSPRWLSTLTTGDPVHAPTGIQYVASRLPQGILDYCGTGLTAPAPTRSPEPTRTQTRTGTSTTTPGPAYVAPAGPVTPGARQGDPNVRADAYTPPRATPVVAMPPGTTTPPGYIAPATSTPSRPAPAVVPGVRATTAPVSAPSMALRDDTLRAATYAALGVAGMSVCSDIAFLPESRDRSIQNTIRLFRASWTPQMVAVMGGDAMPARADGPVWYREMMARVGGQPAARQVLAYVLEQMPTAIVNVCSDIRRQSERE